MIVSNKAIGGDVSVGRNVSMGGKATIQGSVIIGHDLRVKGYLEAPNIIGINKGVYNSAESLAVAYPNPKSGWIAGVMGEGAISLWRVEEGEWVETDDTMTFAFNSDYYDAELEELQSDLNVLEIGHFNGFDFTTRLPYPGSASVVATRVLYSMVLRIFVAEDRENNIYLNWSEGSKYNNYVEGVPTTIVNKIYVDYGEGRLYYRGKEDSLLNQIHIGLDTNLGALNAGKTLKVDPMGYIVPEDVNYEEHIFLTEREWDELAAKQANAMYCVYEEEEVEDDDFIKEEGGTLYLRSRMENGLLIVNGRVENGVLKFGSEGSNSYVENGTLYAEGEVDAMGVFSARGTVTNNILTI